jgi:hypothetical protein
VSLRPLDERTLARQPAGPGPVHGQGLNLKIPAVPAGPGELRSRRTTAGLIHLGMLASLSILFFATTKNDCQRTSSWELDHCDPFTPRGWQGHSRVAFDAALEVNVAVGHVENLPVHLTVLRHINLQRADTFNSPWHQKTVRPAKVHEIGLSEAGDA